MFLLSRLGAEISANRESVELSTTRCKFGEWSAESDEMRGWQNPTHEPGGGWDDDEPC